MASQICNSDFRWEEILRACSTPLVPLMRKMIEKMPEVAVVSCHGNYYRRVKE